MPDLTADDRALLELAAEAAGFSGIDFLAQDHWANVYDANGRQSAWNPLADDGDALRLANKLEMAISHWPHNFPPNVMAGFSIGKCGDNLTEPYGADRDAATRRAIVRAAAKIGKTTAR